MRLEQFLLLEEQLSKKFRVVIDLKSHIDDIKRRMLKGLQGISDDREIIMSWLGVARDAVLIMDKKKVLDINPKIFQIKYDDPEFLIKDNMKILRRIYNASPTRWHHQVANNLFRYANLYWKKADQRVFYDQQYMAGHQRLAFEFENTKPSINSVDDIVRWWSKAIKKYANLKPDEKFGRDAYLWKSIEEKSINELRKAMLFGFELIDKIFRSEGEWVVDQDVFKVPRGSLLMVLDVPKSRLFTDIETPREIVEKNKLRSRYKISFIDKKKFEDFRVKWFKKRK